MWQSHEVSVISECKCCILRELSECIRNLPAVCVRIEFRGRSRFYSNRRQEDFSYGEFV